jgi:hypothetical protein
MPKQKGARLFTHLIRLRKNKRFKEFMRAARSQAVVCVKDVGGGKSQEWDGYRRRVLLLGQQRTSKRRLHYPPANITRRARARAASALNHSEETPQNPENETYYLSRNQSVGSYKMTEYFLWHSLRNTQRVRTFQKWDAH